MDKFDTLVETFRRKTGVASTKLRDSFFQEANDSLAEAERVLRLIEEELKLLDKLSRRSGRNIVSKLKKNLRSLRLVYSQKLSEEEKRSLLASSESGAAFNSKAKATEQRRRAREGITSLEETDLLLKDSKRLLEESSELGISTMVRIDEQTEILLSTKETVEDTHAMTQSAGKILKQMTQRFCANKCLLFLIIFILIIANIGLIFLYRKSSPTERPGNFRLLARPIAKLRQFVHPNTSKSQVLGFTPNQVFSVARQNRKLKTNSSRKVALATIRRKRKDV
jgi:hypothetical protein